MQALSYLCGYLKLQAFSYPGRCYGFLLLSQILMCCKSISLTLANSGSIWATFINLPSCAWAASQEGRKSHCTWKVYGWHTVKEGTALQVPYKELGLFFNISDTSKWLLLGGPQWQLHPSIRSVHETEARWWVPDTDIRSSLINVRLAMLLDVHAQLLTEHRQPVIDVCFCRGIAILSQLSGLAAV